MVAQRVVLLAKVHVCLVVVDMVWIGAEDVVPVNVVRVVKVAFLLVVKGVVEIRTFDNHATRSVYV